MRHSLSRIVRREVCTCNWVQLPFCASGRDPRYQLKIPHAVLAVMSTTFKTTAQDVHLHSEFMHVLVARNWPDVASHHHEQLVRLKLIGYMRGLSQAFATFVIMVRTECGCVHMYALAHIYVLAHIQFLRILVDLREFLLVTVLFILMVSSL